MGPLSSRRGSVEPPAVDTPLAEAVIRSIEDQIAAEASAAAPLEEERERLVRAHTESSGRKEGLLREADELAAEADALAVSAVDNRSRAAALPQEMMQRVVADREAARQARHPATSEAEAARLARTRYSPPR